jgi:arylsulfatase
MIRSGGATGPIVLAAAVVAAAVTVAAAGPSAVAAQDPPNIVLMFPDNLGWGEVGVYGGVRDVPTPNIDRIAHEGIRLDNFNVEYSCTVSRIALLTGRYAARAGGTQATGMTLWEVTIAELLRDLGYATALFGKWHVGGDGWEGSREPQDQGFDEWYGIPGTSHTAQFRTFENYDPATMGEPFIWEGRAGEPSRRVKPYDMQTRRTVDREAAERGVAFMERNVEEGRPFFLFYPITQIHFPTLPHPDFAGTTGAGDIGDAMADVDYNVGLVLDAIDRLGIEDRTLVLWCTDNGAERRRPWRGSSGPWSGFYNSAMEGGIRTPCVIRWPGRIPAGQVSNEIVHQVDLFPTFAAAVGALDRVPDDRPIDGVNQLPFLEGRQDRSNRESIVYMAQGGRIQAVKWRNWKLWYTFPIEPGDPDPTDRVRLFDLRSDPKEETDIGDFNPWVFGVMDSIVTEYEESVRRFPNVPADAKDPYDPRSSGGRGGGR